MCDKSVLAGTGPWYKKHSRWGFNPGPLLVLLLIYYALPVVFTSMYILLAKHSILTGESSSPFLKSPRSVPGEFLSWGILFLYVPAKCPNSGSLMAMGSGGNRKKWGSYFLGRYVPHGGKKIKV